MKRFKTEMRVSSFFPSYMWCLDIILMKSLELKVEMYKSYLHLLSELFPWVLNKSLLIVSISEMFTCWSSHFPLVSHLSLSLNRHNQTQCLVLDAGSERNGNDIRDVRRPVMMLQMLMLSTAEAIGAILANMDVAIENCPPLVLSHNILAAFSYSGALSFSPGVTSSV